jgi:uncharacterized protein (TIGR03790 family)
MKAVCRMMVERGLQFAAVTLIAGTAVGAAEPGSEAVVVYNSALPDSKSVALHYAQARRVPTNQVFGFALSTNEVISRIEFRDTLQRPLADTLAKLRLWRIAPQNVPATATLPAHVNWQPAESKIRYAVLCYGVPLKIAPQPNLKEEVAEKMRPEMRRNEAAVDSELALLPLIEQELPLASPLRNTVYAATNVAALHPTNGVLLVARLDGPTPQIAMSLVDKAIEAETNGLWGRAYFDLRNTTDPGYKMGDDWLRNASEISRRLGFETVVDQQPVTFPAGFPLSQVAFYAGWYDEHVSGPFAQPTVEFMPGAFAYHLHSASADTLRSTSRHWVGPLLAKGATATMGCVYEPYLSGTPDLDVFVARFLFAGFSFGEAAYASQPVLSWQTTVVGDPLYRPFGINPDQLQDQLQQRHSKLVEWSYLKLINANYANGKPLGECIEALESIDATKTSAVLAEKLADFYAAQGKPSSAAHQYGKALKLDPSPQQRIRLLLTLGQRLAALEREAEAFQCYEDLLNQFPDYPDKVGIYARLLPLARKLNKTAEIEKFQALVKPESTTPAAK